MTPCTVRLLSVLCFRQPGVTNRLPACPNHPATLSTATPPTSTYGWTSQPNADVSWWSPIGLVSKAVADFYRARLVNGVEISLTQAAMRAGVKVRAVMTQVSSRCGEEGR